MVVPLETGSERRAKKKDMGNESRTCARGRLFKRYLWCLRIAGRSSGAGKELG
jgi:hypothetical protein